MANPEHLAILKQGVKRWNAWRLRLYKKAELGREPDLSGANLFGDKLNGVDFSNVDLYCCDLRSAKLMGADFRGACLGGTRLSGAYLAAAHFGPLAVQTDMHDSSFRMYPPVVHENHSLNGPNVADSIFYSTIIDSIDLRKWSGLELARHSGPSKLSIDALIKSRGQVPIAFLRGCGVPDILISYLPALAEIPIQFYSCFISFSTHDQGFADRLNSDLQANGVRCWFAPHDIQGGKKLHEQLDEAIRVHERLLLILSEHSINSEWVKTEIAKARKREIRERRRVLFPIRLVDFETFRNWECFDADTGKDSAREIREYFIPDFSNWKDHDSYQAAFERLLRDLKAEPGSPPAP